MRTQLVHGNRVGEGVSDQVVGRLRQQDLSAVPGREESCHAVERRAKVVAVLALHRSRVQGHAHFDGRLFGPRLCVKRRLPHKRGRDRMRSHRERRAESVAHRLEDKTVGTDDRLTHQHVMTSKGCAHHFSMRLP